MPPILTLTTDFGTRDAYVAILKGLILQRCPAATLVDISHDITPQDVMEAAFVLREAAPHFPPETVHLVVVDPGVGTARRPLALRAHSQTFVGPDNGLFALVLDGHPPEAIVVLDRPEAWRTPTLSHTFHGRDLFAPVAAALADGAPLNAVGSPTDHLAQLHWALPIADDQGVRGWVVHIDHFGNCITNIPQALFEAARAGRAVKCYAGSEIISALHPTYGSVEPGEPLLLFGSHGFLELAVHAGNASDLLSIRKGTSLNVVFAANR